MEIHELLISRTQRQIAELLNNQSLNLDVEALAKRYVLESYTIENSVSDLLAIELQNDLPGRIIKFNLLAAAGLVASLIGGIAGATNPIIFGSVIVSSIASLTGLFEKTSPAEGLLFWIIYEMENHQGKLRSIRSRFNTLSKKLSEVDAADFRPALQALINIGAIEQQGGSIKVIEKLVVLWFKEK